MFFKKKAKEEHVINLAVELSKLQEEVSSLTFRHNNLGLFLDDMAERQKVVETKLKELEK